MRNDFFFFPDNLYEKNARLKCLFLTELRWLCLTILIKEFKGCVENKKILYIIHIYIHIYITSLSIEIYLWCGTSSILDWASVLDILKFRSCKKKHGEKSKIKEDKSPTKIFSLFEIKQNKNKQK